MKCKQLKPIAAAAVWEAGEKHCEKFRREFTKFLDWCIKTFPTFDFSRSLHINYILPMFEEHPEWEKFFVDKGFIEIEEEEITYGRGSILTHREGSKWMIVASRTQEACLVCIGPPDHKYFGYSYSGKLLHMIKDPDNITVGEMNEICGNLKSHFVEGMD